MASNSVARDHCLLLNWSNRQRYWRREAECAERKVQKETLGGNEKMEMKLTGTPEEIEKLLNAIGGSKEQSKKINDMSEKITNLQNKLVNR